MMRHRDHYQRIDPDVPERSRLYHMAPIGIGTPQVESLTSYLARLAEAHCTKLGKLLATEVAPLIGRPVFQNTVDWTRDGHTLNGVGEHPRRCVDILQRLTRQPNLKPLTFLPWSQVVDRSLLVRSRKAWCSSCFSDWRSQGQILYEPLLWACEQVNVCPVHGDLLKTRCPNAACSAWQPMVSNFARSGSCWRCDQWLGTGEFEQHNDPPVISQSEEYERWAAEIVSMMIVGNDGAIPTRWQLASALYACSVAASRHMRKTRRSLIPGLPASRLKEAYEQEAALRIDTLLHICYHLERTPWQLITEYSIVNVFKDTPMRSKRRREKPSVKRTTANLQHVRKELDEIVADSATPTLAAVAERLNVEPHYLRRYFRPHCKQIVSKAHPSRPTKPDGRSIQDLREAIQRTAVVL